MATFYFHNTLLSNKLIETEIIPSIAHLTYRDTPIASVRIPEIFTIQI